MQIHVYGRITDILHNMEMDARDLPDTEQLKNRLVLLFPALAGIHFAIAVNNRIVGEKFPLKQQDVISLLPPFSGG
jgi:sulfur-carrier protein